MISLRVVIMFLIQSILPLFFSNSTFATIRDLSKQTEKFKTKNKKQCPKKIDEFLETVTPYSLGPDEGPETPRKYMECREIKRKFKKLTPIPGGPVGCKIIGKCVVVEDTFCEGLIPREQKKNCSLILQWKNIKKKLT